MRKHSVLYGVIFGLLVIVMAWFITSGIYDILLSFLSSILTLSLVASIIYLVQRKSKFKHD